MPVVKFPQSSSAEAEAAAWLAQLDGGKVSASDMVAFREWLTRSPQNRSEFERLMVLWNDIDSLILQRIDAPVPANLEKSHASISATGWQLKTSFVMVCCLVVVCLLAYWGGTDRFFQGQDYTQTYITHVGQQKHIGLPDGSRVLINTNSELIVSYSSSSRRLELRRGEAHFEVSRDPGRPFVVASRSGAVKALGTAFTVRLYEDSLDVTVTEGKVELEPSRFFPNDYMDNPKANASERKPAILHAGQSALVKDVVKILPDAEPRNLDKKLSWHEGMLLFDGEPLKLVVAELSRYTPLEISIVDQRIEEMSIGGYFRIGDIDSLLFVLENSFNIQASRLAENHIQLSAKTTN